MAKLTKAQKKLIDVMTNGSPVDHIEAGEPVALHRDCKGILGIPYVASIKTIEVVLRLGLIKMAYSNHRLGNGRIRHTPILYLANHPMPQEYCGDLVTQEPQEVLPE